MATLYRNLFAALLASSLLALEAGCQTPPFMPPPQQRPERATPSDLPPTIDKVSAAADKASEADVMREVQKISAEDPLAGQQLLDELSKADAKMWPLVVQQYRSRQALRDQLLRKSKRQTTAAEGDHDEFAASPPPSERIDRLADPRGIRPDPRLEQAFAAATPANMPAPETPVDHVAGPQEMIVRQSPEAMRVPATAVEDAASSNSQYATGQVLAVTAVAEPRGKVEQAIYSPESTSTGLSEGKLEWRQHLKLAIEDLNANFTDGPRSTAEVHRLVSLRIMNLLAGDTEEALQAIPNVSTEEQDYWSSQLFALATFLDHHRQPDDQRRAAASVVHLDEAVGHLRELGALSLRNLAFCKNVYGYGAYEPIEQPIFSAGQQITLYLEVENFHSESTIKGYNTKLGASYELVDDEGERLASGDFPNVEDTCQSRRRDFHIQYGLVLPKNAKAGKYHLKISMKDRQSDKMGSASIEFDVR